jgi:hypothetical protein
VTGQDRVLWNLCRPRYLIDHVRHLVCFDEEGCIRKFARYSHYRVATQLRDRVDQRGNGRRQRGGLIRVCEVFEFSLSRTDLSSLIGSRVISILLERRRSGRLRGKTLMC